MTVQRGVWHGEAWDVPQERMSRAEASHFMANLAAVAQERDGWRHRAQRLELDVARMKHIMDQRAEIIAEMRKALNAKHVPPSRAALPWETWRSY